MVGAERATLLCCLLCSGADDMGVAAGWLVGFPGVSLWVPRRRPDVLCVTSLLFGLSSCLLLRRLVQAMPRHAWH